MNYRWQSQSHLGKKNFLPRLLLTTFVMVSVSCLHVHMSNPKLNSSIKISPVRMNLPSCFDGRDDPTNCFTVATSTCFMSFFRPVYVSHRHTCMYCSPLSGSVDVRVTRHYCPTLLCERNQILPCVTTKLKGALCVFSSDLKTNERPFENKSGSGNTFKEASQHIMNISNTLWTHLKVFMIIVMVGVNIATNW